MEFFSQEDEDDNNVENAGSGDNAADPPIVIDDSELLAREKREALTTVHDAVWSVSSAKHGNGVTALLDGSHNTFWQSDGILPHTISIDFPRLTPLLAVALYLDFQQDESYTPRKLRVQAGTHAGDVADVAAVTVNDPQGWVLMRLAAEAEAQEPWELPANNRASSSLPHSPLIQLSSGVAEYDDYAEFLESVVWCTHLRIVLEENRQNGRDSHVRGVRVLGPARQCVYTTPEFTQHMLLR